MFGAVHPTFAGVAGFTKLVQTYGTPGSSGTVNVPGGASQVIIEVISAGAGGSSSGSGAGGTYVKKTVTNLSGITALYLSVAASTAGNATTVAASSTVRVGTSSGTVLALAYGPQKATSATAANSTGDVVNVGGAGSASGSNPGGGGAGGTTGPGGAGASNAAGASGGGDLAGNGGVGAAGNNYGGGGGVTVGGPTTYYAGAGGVIRLTWS